MLSKEQKKEAISQFKERKPSLGIFAVRCVANGQVWVGASRNLEATRNGTWFSLRLKGHRDKTLQEEWNAQGESAFQYEILETLSEDVLPQAVSDLLIEKKKQWIRQLDARALL